MSGVGLGGGSWIGSGGGGGGVSGAANIGAAGVGPYDSLAAGLLQFKSVNAGSSKVTVTDDVVNKEIDIDIVEEQIDVRNLKNVSPGVNGSFAGWSDAGLLNAVPGWTFDDIGALKVGAQNSLTIPAGTTDYISIGISPTVSNPVTNLSAVQLNSPINAAVGTYSPFQVYGYGTNAPATYMGFTSQPGYSGTGTNATHFMASGSYAITGTLKALDFSASSNAAHIQGVSLAPTGSATDGFGFSYAPTGTYTDISGLVLNLSSATVTNRPVGIDLSGGILSANCQFNTTSNLPTLVDSGNIIRPVFEVKAGSAITGTDVLLSNLAGFMDFKDNYSGSALGLGAASVGFVSQLAVASGKTASNVSMLTAGLAIDATSTGGTVTDVHLVRGFAANFGGTLNIGTIYGLQIETGISALATTAFGISVEDTGAENYLAKSLKIGGGTKTVTHQSIALEVDGTRSMRIPVLTTAQRTALPNITGTMVFDSDTLKGYLNDGTGWHQFA